MLMRIQSISAGVLCLFILMAPTVIAAQNSVEIAGVVKSAAGFSVYELEVALALATPIPDGSELLVYAEPSHTLLFSHLTQSGLEPAPKAAQPRREALISTSSEAPRFRHRATALYDSFNQDQHISVSLRLEDREILLAHGTVDLTSFRFTTTFSLSLLKNGKFEPKAASIRHCCSSAGSEMPPVPPCSVCETCDTAFFECNVISCTIWCTAPF